MVGMEKPYRYIESLIEDVLNQRSLKLWDIKSSYDRGRYVISLVLFQGWWRVILFEQELYL